MNRRLGIIRTLFWKEFTVLRYNTALQFILLLFIILSAIISFSKNTGQDRVLSVYFVEGGHSRFANYLRTHAEKIRFPRKRPPSSDQLREDEILVAIPPDLRWRPRGAEYPPLVIRFDSRYPRVALVAAMSFRAHLLGFFSIQPPVDLQLIDEKGTRLHESRAKKRFQARPEPTPKKELTMVMVCTMTLLVISFNLFCMIFSEEKHSKVLLTQMISPARAIEIVCTKFLFYLGLNLLVASLVALIYSPKIVIQPAFWIVMIMGSLCYMSLSLLIVAYSRKQSTASLLSLGYLFVVGIIVLLSRDFYLFTILRRCLPEKYIFQFIAKIFSDEPVRLLTRDFAQYSIIVALVMCVSLLLFGKRGLRTT